MFFVLFFSYFSIVMFWAFMFAEKDQHNTGLWFTDLLIY